MKMERLYPHLRGISSNLDRNEAISLLSYLSQFSGTFLSQKEFDNATNICYFVLRRIFNENKIIDIVLEQLEITEDYGYLEIDNYILVIRDKSYFQLILLCSLKHHQEIFKANNSKNSLKKLLPYFHKLILPNKQESIHGLKLLDMLLKKHKDIFDELDALHLLKLSNFNAISQIEGFKYYTQSIAKTVLTSVNLSDIHKIISVNDIPVRGIPTQLLNVKNTNVKVLLMVEKICQMFQNNIESRDAGFLYKELMFDSFEQWQIEVWPFFAEKMVLLDPEGEFFNSLLKYWIPTTVRCYKSKLYKLMTKQLADNIFKAYVLLDTRKKGFYEEVFEIDLKRFICTKSISNIGLKILCNYHKMTIIPTQNELELFIDYLYNFEEDILENDQEKCVSKFFSQIFLTAHEYLRKNDEYQFIEYKKFFDIVFKYCKICLESNRKELGSQILRVLWETAIGGSDSLTLNYKLENKHSYDPEENRFYYQCIESLREYSLELRFLIIKIFEDEYCSIGSSLTKLLSEKGYEIRLDIENTFLLNLIDKNSSMASIESVETVKNWTSVLISNNDYKTNKEFLLEIIENIKKRINNDIESKNKLFKIVLYSEVLYAIPDDLKLVRTPLICELLEMCLVVIHAFLKVEIRGKILEAFINVTLTHLSSEKTAFYEFMNKISILHQMQEIITTCNMKRPTTLAGDVIRIVSKSMIQNEYEKRQRNDFLAKVLSGLHETPTCQNLTIRRCPESRLAVHALCLADQNEQKTLLHWSLDHICGVNTASAIFCAEALIADNTLQSHTLFYIPHLIMSCVKLFEKRDWVLRNAILQLTKAIIDRTLGVVIGYNNRSKSVEDLFLLYPKLASKFYEILSQDILTDSCMIIFQFFIESQSKKQAFRYEFLEIVRQSFFVIFSKILEEDSQYFGTFAARSLVSLCLEDEIPSIFYDILAFIYSNFDKILKNHTLKNFMLLLEELYEKYQRHTEFFSCAKPNLKIMHKNYLKLISNFSQSKNPIFDFLLIKVLPQESVINNLKLNENDFEHRIWKHNYLPDLIKNSKVENLPFLLNEVLNHTIPEFIQIKILSLVTKMYNENSPMQNLTLTVLFEKMSSIDDSKNYLLSFYLKVILFLIKNKVNSNVSKRLISNVRNNYRTVKNVYKIVLFNVILSKIEHKMLEDNIFIKKSLKNLSTCNFEDEEFREIVSESLIYFYENSNCDCQKYEILRITLNIFLNYGMFHFVKLHTKLEIESPVVALIKLCETAKNLEEMYFYSFLKDAYGFFEPKSKINQSIDVVTDSKTYFSRQSSIYIDQNVIKKIVVHFLTQDRKPV